jgi:hypothetical protein
MPDIQTLTEYLNFYWLAGRIEHIDVEADQF